MTKKKKRETRERGKLIEFSHPFDVRKNFVSRSLDNLLNINIDICLRITVTNVVDRFKITQFAFDSFAKFIKMNHKCKRTTCVFTQDETIGMKAYCKIYYII